MNGTSRPGSGCPKSTENGLVVPRGSRCHTSDDDSIGERYLKTKHAMSTILVAVSDPVLTEVPCSFNNIVLPPETTQYLVALPSGGFAPCPEDGVPRRKPLCTIAKKSLAQRRADNMARNARRLAELGLTSLCVKKRVSRPRKGKAPSVCPPLSRRKDVIPEKKVRLESHPLLHRRVFVVWDELTGPTRFHGKVTVYDSARQGAPLYVEYEDGDGQWEAEADVKDVVSCDA